MIVLCLSSKSIDSFNLSVTLISKGKLGGIVPTSDRSYGANNTFYNAKCIIQQHILYLFNS